MLLDSTKNNGIDTNELLITNLMDVDKVYYYPEIDNRKTLFNFISEKISEMHLTPLSQRKINDAFIARDRLGTTVIKGTDAAVPHVRLRGIEKSFAMFVNLKIPIGFEEREHGQQNYVARIFFLIVPYNSQSIHLCHLAILVEFLLNEAASKEVNESTCSDEIYTAIQNWQNENLSFFKYFIE